MNLLRKQIFISLLFLLVPLAVNSQEIRRSVFTYQGIDFYPYLRTGMRYIDNVYSTREKKGDFLLTVSPGIRAKLPVSRQIFEINYGLDFALFTRYSSLNSTNQNISGLADLNLDNYSLNLGKSYNKFYQAVTYIEEYVESMTNSNKLLFTAEFRLFSFDVGWRNFSYDYEPGKNYDTWDRKENIYTFTNYLKIYPKTSLLTEYTYGQIKYPYRLGRDAEYHLFLTGVRGKLTAKLSGLVRFGYQIRNYQTLKDWQGLSIWTNLNEKFSSVNEVNLALERAINESEFTDENYYLANAISVNFSQIFPESGLNLGIGLNLRNEEYPKPVGNPPRIREDKIFGYSISLGYKFWRLPLGGLTYSSTQRNSNFNEYDYNTQTISLSIRRLF